MAQGMGFTHFQGYPGNGPASGLHPVFKAAFSIAGIHGITGHDRDGFRQGIGCHLSAVAACGPVDDLTLGVVADGNGPRVLFRQ